MIRKSLLTLCTLLLSASAFGCGVTQAPGLGDVGAVSAFGADASHRAAGPANQPPAWVQNAIFYQIFPERFANGDTRNDPPNTQNWDTGVPTYTNYFGGDIAGVIEKLPYLHQLGINAIYFNPLFEADTNHKYTTVDYTKIDPEFGTLQDFDKMVATAHSLGIKVILDGVFNHTSNACWAFQQASKTGPSSPTWNWYHFSGFPVTSGSYWTYGGFGFMPQLNVAGNPALQQYLLNNVVDYWTKRNIDGWRLDVPLLIQSDSFWQAFRARVKTDNPNAYIVGEAWENHGDDARPWLQGDKFDAVMNYQFYQLMHDYFAKGTINSDQFDYGMMALRGRFSPAAEAAEFNVIGTHDTSRFLYEAGGDLNKLKLAATFQMTYLGAPVIYYGDEIGMTGGNDPDNRRPMAWNHINQDVLGFYRKLIAIRKTYPALRASGFSTLMRRNDFGQMVCMRTDGKDTFLVVINKGSNPTVTMDTTANNLGHVPFADGSRFEDVLGGAAIQSANGQLTIQTGPEGEAILHLVSAGAGRSAPSGRR
jgi:cyclomaltodextrinase